MSNLLKNLVGSDLRYIVVGGEVLFAIMRKNEKSFLSNITAGGSATKIDIEEKHKHQATKIAKILGLDYCSVDFFNTIDNEPLLCEVNANPGNIELNEKLTGVNQAEAFTRYIVKEVYSI